MTTNRRQFIGGIGALAASTFPMPAFAQAEAEGCRGRRRARRRHGREICRQGRRHRRDAGRAGEALHDVLPFQSLSRQLQDLRRDHAFLRQDHQGLRHQASAPEGGVGGPRQEAGDIRQRPRPALRPAGGRPGHRHQVRLGAGLFRRGEQETAACLAGRAADPIAQAPAQRAVGRLDDRDDRAAQSVSLPARSL